MSEFRVGLVSSDQGGAEEVICQAASAVCVADLKKAGVWAKNFYTEEYTDDSNLADLNSSIRAANDHHCTLVIALHNDSAGGKKKDVVWPICLPGHVVTGRKLGAALAKRLGMRAQEPETGRRLNVLVKTDMEAYLLEVGDYGTPAGLAWLRAHTTAIGHALAESIIEVFNLGKGVTVAEVEKQLSGLFDVSTSPDWHPDQPANRRHVDILLARAKEKWVEPLNRAIAALTERIEDLEGGAPIPVPAPANPTPLSLDTPVTGVWDGNIADLLFKFKEGTVAYERARTLAPHYYSLGHLFSLRTDVLWAQMLHETGNLLFGGVAVFEDNNWCGLKTHDGSGQAKFDSPLAGARAHFEHMNWYARPVCTPPCGVADPRHLGPHQSNGKVVTVADLAGKWCPDADYAEKVVKRGQEFGL